MKGFIISLSSHDDWGKKTRHPPSASWRTKRAVGSFISVPKAWQPESQWGASQSDLKGLGMGREKSSGEGAWPRLSLRTWSTDTSGTRWGPAQEESELTIPGTFLFYRGLQQMGWCWPALLRVRVLLSLLCQRLVFSENTPTDMPRSDILPVTWASLTSV